MRVALARRVFAAAAAGSLAFALLLSLRPASVAQTQKPAAAADAPCDEQRAVALVRQQAEEARRQAAARSERETLAPRRP